MISSGRLQVAPIVSRVVSPEESPQIYDELCDSAKFPIGTVFDWRDINGKN
jgi:threonine dehydrogenase-like Zn-dependent dehydrogenase